MLEHLIINNYVLIPHLDLDLRKGFSVITGETGAGKSIIMGALSLLLGDKADKESIRMGEPSAEISGIFNSNRSEVRNFLEDRGIESDGQLIIRRVIKNTGRSFFTVNGTPITISDGQLLGRLLVDISSQHSHQSLMKKDVQLAYLDHSSGTEPLLEKYKKEYSLLLSLEKERAELQNKIDKALEDKDYIEYCYKELVNADLQDEQEEEKLKRELELAASSEYIISNLEDLCEMLGNASSILSNSLFLLAKLIKKDSRLDVFQQRLESSEIEVSDIMESLKEHVGFFNLDPYEMEEKNQRLSILQKIRKKYGGSLGKAIERREEYAQQLECTNDSEGLLKTIDEKIIAQRNKVLDIAGELSAKRKRKSQVLSRQITEKLGRLGMKDAVFSINLERTDLSMHGLDKVDYMVCANKGEKNSRLEDCVSGGELSRIMLALKSVFSKDDDVETLIFDEIDAGVGGATAYDVASELKSISKFSQVLAISHLAQIASKADEHYIVSKSSVSGRTVSTLKRIDGEERVKEIARLLSGDTSEISMEHARTLLEV